jgi:hypothetical protein
MSKETRNPIDARIAAALCCAGHVEVGISKLEANSGIRVGPIGSVLGPIGTQKTSAKMEIRAAITET